MIHKMLDNGRKMNFTEQAAGNEWKTSKVFVTATDMQVSSAKFTLYTLYYS